MKAAVVTGVGAYEITTVADPTPGPRDLVVAVAGVGICGTDLHILKGEYAPSFPVIPGHEFAGEVVALGSDAEAMNGLRIGDRVAVDPSIYCHECHYCRMGRDNQCERWGSIGVTRAGAAAEYVVAPAANAVVLPDSVSTADAALIEPLSCAVRGYDVLASQLASHILIYGSGTMGLMMLEMAKRVGAASVDVVDLNPARLETAVALGCTNAVASADEIERPYGWELVIDATGNTAAIQDGLGRVGKGGTFLQFGVSDYAARVEIEPYKIFNQEITITGSMAVLRSFERAADLFASGVLDPEVFISHRLPLEAFGKGIDMVTNGVGRKIQLQPGS